MSVELLDTSRFHGYRGRRQIEGKTYQEYFSLKPNGKRLRGQQRTAVQALAQARDDELRELQQKLRGKSARAVHIAGKGQVRGILCRLKAEKNGSKTPVFQVGLMSVAKGKIVNTTVSINKFGVEAAWQRAVDYFATHKGISRRSRAYRELLAAQPSAAQVRRLTRQQ